MGEARRRESAAWHLNDQAVIAWFYRERLLALPRRACCSLESERSHGADELPT